MRKFPWNTGWSLFYFQIGFTWTCLTRIILFITELINLRSIDPYHISCCICWKHKFRRNHRQNCNYFGFASSFLFLFDKYTFAVLIYCAENCDLILCIAITVYPLVEIKVSNISSNKWTFLHLSEYDYTLEALELWCSSEYGCLCSEFPLHSQANKYLPNKNIRLGQIKSTRMSKNCWWQCNVADAT